MKIIKQGKLPETELYVITCRNCRTEFEFERGEGRYISDQRDGDSIEIACPLCKKKCYADPSKDKKVSASAYDYYNK